MFIETLFIGISLLAITSFIVWRRARQQLLSEEAVFDLILLVFIGGLVASRVVFIIFHFDAFGLSILRWILFITYPGLSLMGGTLGGLAFLWYRVKKSSLPFWRTLDSFVLALVSAGLFAYFVHLIYLLIFLNEAKSLSTLSVYDQFTSLLAIISYIVLGFLLILIVLLIVNKKWPSARGSNGLIGLFGISMTVFLVDFSVSSRVYYGWITYEQIMAVTVFVAGLVLVVIRIKDRSKQGMISVTRKLWNNAYSRLRKDEQKTKKALSDLQKEDPFTDTNHVLDSVASDTDAFEQKSHLRIESLRRMLTSRLQRIRGAQSLIEKGKYGACEDCGKKVSSQRLSVMPTATICVSCEKKREKGKK